MMLRLWYYSLASGRRGHAVCQSAGTALSTTTQSTAGIPAKTQTFEGESVKRDNALRETGALL